MSNQKILKVTVQLLTLLIISCNLMAQGAHEESDSANNNFPVSPQSSELESMGNKIIIKQVVEVAPDSIKTFKNKKEFAYITTLDSLLKSVSKLPADTIHVDNLNRVRSPHPPVKASTDQIFESTSNPFNDVLIKVLLWIIAAGFIGFVLFKLFLGEGFFKKETQKQIPADINGGEEALDFSGYDKLINEAIVGKNYRLAVRYSYLRVLHVLNLKGLIKLSPEKTNYEYVKALAAESYHTEFVNLTLNYEYVWYGHFDINLRVFLVVQEHFKLFNQRFIEH